MSNAEVNTVSVTVEDGLKAKEDYAPARKASVTISASVPEGKSAEDALEYVRRLADSKVFEIIHNIKADASKAAPSLPSSPPAVSGAATPSGRTKADLEADAVKAAAPKKAKPPKISKATKETVEGNIAEDNQVEQDVPFVEITDVELTNAITKKNASLGKPQEISKLLERYGGRPAPKQVRDIPKEQRNQFLADLEALR